jgi:hypothetical protein
MSDVIVQIEALQNLLISEATGGNEDNEEYQKLRQMLLQDSINQNLIPKFILTNRNLSQFWQFIKFEYKSYAERRDFIWKAFQPLFEKIESNALAPSDQIVSDAVRNLDSAYIHNIWQKALERRSSDPEGAITLARTLLESTCKYILDERKIAYGNAPDINQLYRLVNKELNLSPSQHTEQTFKQILGGCSSIIEGLGSLRNKVGDAHGQGKQNFKPLPRHAELAVNLAGAMAVFLFSTWDIKQNNKPELDL